MFGIHTIGLFLPTEIISKYYKVSSRLFNFKIVILRRHLIFFPVSRSDCAVLLQQTSIPVSWNSNPSQPNLVSCRLLIYSSSCSELPETTSPSINHVYLYKLQWTVERETGWVQDQYSKILFNFSGRYLNGQSSDERKPADS